MLVIIRQGGWHDIKISKPLIGVKLSQYNNNLERDEELILSEDSIPDVIRELYRIWDENERDNA